MGAPEYKSAERCRTGGLTNRDPLMKAYAGDEPDDLLERPRDVTSSDGIGRDAHRHGRAGNEIRMRIGGVARGNDRAQILDFGRGQRIDFGGQVLRSDTAVRTQPTAVEGNVSALEGKRRRTGQLVSVAFGEATRIHCTEATIGLQHCNYRRRSAVVIRDEQLAAAVLRPPRDVRDLVGIVRVARAADDSGSSPSDSRDDAVHLEGSPHSRNLHEHGV